MRLIPTYYFGLLFGSDEFAYDENLEVMNDKFNTQFYLYLLLLLTFKIKRVEEIGVYILKVAWQLSLTIVVKILYVTPVLLTSFVVFFVLVVFAILIDIFMIVFKDRSTKNTLTANLTKIYIMRICIFGGLTIRKMVDKYFGIKTEHQL